MYQIRVENFDKLIDALHKSPQLIGGELENATKKAGAVIVETEKAQVPIASGALRRSINMIYRPISVTISPLSKYAYWVNFGSGLFGDRKDYIRPRTAKVLAWRGKGGQMIFAKKVKGQKPNPFVERTVKITEDKVNTIFNNVLSAITEKL